MPAPQASPSAARTIAVAMRIRGTDLIVSERAGGPPTATSGLDGRWMSPANRHARQHLLAPRDVTDRIASRAAAEARHVLCSDHSYIRRTPRQTQGETHGNRYSA